MRMHAILNNEVELQPGAHVIAYGRAWTVKQCLNNSSLFAVPKLRFKLVLVAIH